MELLKIGTNSKLGKGIASWNIPAVLTCPGKTKLCESVCYANKGLFRMQTILHEKNRISTESDNFVDKINSELSGGKIKAIRIHAAGDFYSKSYINKWIQIVKDNPSIKFWCYTRSWRVPSLVSNLKQLSKQPNIQLFASIDKESDKEQIPNWLRKAEIVEHFEKKDSYVQCPNQKNKAITCEKCTYCFKSSTNKKVDVMFAIH